MELAHRFLDGGFDVTFVNTKYNHDRVMAAAAAAGTTTLAGAGGRLRLIAVADGIDDAGDHENLILLNAAMQEAIPPQLEALLTTGMNKDADGLTLRRRPNVGAVGVGGLQESSPKHPSA
jgi:hypothetical protein